MTVNKSVATTSSKTKKKSAAGTTSSSSLTQATTSTTSSSKKVIDSSSSKSSKTVTSSQQITQDGAVSKSSSASSLQISDISHLPVNTQLVSYTVTEALPQGIGEKITKYEDSGATSTEYRHFIAQDQSSKTQSSNITQISSVLNQSLSNLSEISAATNETYIVHEPKEEVRVANKNDGAWNGKFVYETPIKSGNEIVERTSQSTSSQKRSYNQKSSSDSYVIEIVDGKERIVDRKHKESEFADAASNDEFLATKSGTNIKPEIHYSQKVKESSLAYDSENPDLKTPKTRSLESGKDVHKIGDAESRTSYKTEDNALVDGKSFKSIKDHGSNVKSKSITNENGAVNLENLATTTDSSQLTKHQTDISKISTQSKISDTKISKSSKTQTSKSESTYIANTEPIEGDIDTLVTTTITYYDSKGNVVKVDTDVQKTDVEHVPVPVEPGTQITTTTTTYYDARGNIIEEDVDIDRKRLDSSLLDTKYVSSDSKYVTESKNIEDTRSSTEISEDHKNISSTTLRDIDIRDRTKNISSTTLIDDKTTDTHSKNITDESIRTDYTDSKKDIRYVDENYVDLAKIRSSHTATDSKNFYGHAVDSRGTIVDNTYDTTAVQNVIGTKGKVIKDNTLDTTDIIYSNDRLYGKTGWSGKFVNETPTQPKGTSTPKEPKDSKPGVGDKRGPQEKSPKETDKKTRKPEDGPGDKTHPQHDDKIVEYVMLTTKEGPKKFPVYRNEIDTTITQSSTTIDKKFKTQNIKDVKKTSSTFIDNESTVEYVLIDGKRVPRRPGDKPTQITKYILLEGKKIPVEPIKPSAKPKKDAPPDVEYIIIGGKLRQRPKRPQTQTEIIEYVLVDGVAKPKGWDTTIIDSKTVSESYQSVTNLQDTKTTLIKDSQTFIDDQRRSVEHLTTSEISKDGPGYPRKPSDAKKFPDDGKHPKNLDRYSDDYILIDGKLRPRRPDERRPKRPDDITDSKTVIESYETVTNLQDSKTTIIKDSQTVVDDQRQSVEHYTTSDVYDSSKDGPRRPGYPSKPGDKAPIQDGPKDGRSPTKDGRYPEDTRTKPGDRKGPKPDDKKGPKPDGKKGPTPSDDEPVDYVIVGGKLRPRKPSDKPRQPSTTEVVEYIIVDGVRRPKRPEDIYSIDSKTVIENYESVTNLQDSKTTIIKDSQTVVDDQKKSVEHYTTSEVYDSSKDGPRKPRYPGEKIPIQDGPKDDKRSKSPTKDGRYPEDTRAKPDDKRRPKPDDKKGPKFVEDGPVEYVIVGGKLRPRKPKQPSTTEEVTEYIIVDGVRRPRRPDVIDSKTVIESYESVTNLQDSKTTIVKDSQTFVDDQRVVEHYTTSDVYDSTRDGPKQPRRPIEEGPDGGKGPKYPETRPKDGKPRKPSDLVTKDTTVTDKKFVDIRDVKTTDVVDRTDVFIQENIVDIKDIVSYYFFNDIVG